MTESSETQRSLEDEWHLSEQESRELYKLTKMSYIQIYRLIHRLERTIYDMGQKLEERDK